MADLYYIDSDYFTPDSGYYVYIADAGSAVTSTATMTCNAGKLQSAAVTITSAFSPTLTVDVLKNHAAVLDAVATISAIPTVNRSITQTIDSIANVNAMADRSRDYSSTLSSSTTVSAVVGLRQDTSATLSSTATLSANGLNVQLASATLSSISNFYCKPYLTYERPLLIGYFDNQYTSLDTSTKALGSASVRLQGVPLSYYAEPQWYSGVDEYNIDFWVSKSGYNNRSILTYYNEANSKKWEVSFSSAFLRFSIDGTNFTATTQGMSDNPSWHHVSISVSNVVNKITAWVNGTRVLNQLAFTPVTADNTNKRLYFGQSGGLTNFLWLDEVHISYGASGLLSSINRGITTTSITVPTAENTNNPTTTGFLGHFNTDYNDDITVTQLATASLSSTATFTVQANNSAKQATAALSSSASVSVTAIKAVLADSALSSASSITASIGLLKGIASSQTVTASVTAQAYRVKQASVNVGALFTPNININIVLNTFAILESTATLSITAVKTARITRTLTATATQSTAVKKVAGITRTLSAAASITARIGFRKSFASAISSQAALTATAITPTLATASLSAFFNCTPFISRTFGTGRPRPLISNGGELADISAVGVNSIIVDQQGEYIRIPADPGLQNFGVLEFWFGMTPDSLSIDSFVGGPSNATNAGWGAPLLTYGLSSNYIFRLQLTRTQDSGGVYNLTYDDSTGGDSGVVNDSGLSINLGASPTWFKVRVIRTADNALTVNLYNQSGTLLGTHSGNYNANVPGWEQGITFWALDLTNQIWNGTAYVKTYVRTNPIWIDEILLTDINGITNSLQTQPWLFSDQTDVLALYHFDGIAPYQWPGGIGTFDNQDDYSIRQTFTANLQTLATQTTNAWKVVSASAAISSAFTHTTTAVVRRNAVMSVNVTATQTALGDRSRLTAVALSTTAVQITEPKKFVGYFSVNNTIAATQTILGTRVRFVTPQLEAIATELTAAVKNATGTVTLESTASVSATVRKITDQPIVVAASATVDVDAQKIIVNGSTASIVSSLLIDATNIQTVTAPLVSTATLTASVSKQTGIVASLTTTATVIATILRIRQSAVALASAVTVITNNQILRLAQAQLSSQFTPIFTITKLVKAQAALSSQGFVLTAGQVINIDPYLTITVEPESRLWKIDPESRITVIEQETRVNIV